MAKRRKIKGIDLEKAVADLLEEYGDAVYEVLEKSVKEVTDEARDKLKAVRNFAPNGHPTGAYSADWVNDKNEVGRLKTQQVVHNEEHYRLTHLLEFGHANRGGGRTNAYPHIAPVNDWAQSEIVRVVERKINDI